jgi:hypothetical protein
MIEIEVSFFGQIAQIFEEMGNIFYPPPVLVPLFVYECSVVNSRKRKCFRAKVYKSAEKYHAKVRPGTTDGIGYNNDDLKVKLVFKDERDCEEFQSAVREIPLDYRKRSRNLPEGDLTITDSVAKVYISESASLGLQRIFYNDYQSQTGDPNGSAMCDTASDFTDGSYVSAVFLNDAVRLRLIDSETSTFMFRKKPEKCHLKSQSKFPVLKNDPNNILYLSRTLHEYFDGINQDNGVPAFILTYVKHEPEIITRICDGNILHVYETMVSVTFRTELDKTVLSPYFRDHTIKSQIRIEFCLYFENPEDFKEYAAYKAAETRAKWASLAGPEGHAYDDDV